MGAPHLSPPGAAEKAWLEVPWATVSRTTGASCARCGRPLKDPDSIAAGMGPTCAGRASRSDSGSLLGDQAVLNDCGTLQEVGLVCRRLENGNAAANVPHVVVHHSHTGFEWAYGGSGPAELALNVMHALLPPVGMPTPVADKWYLDVARGNHTVLGGVRVSNDALRLHQDFKWQFIAKIPRIGGRIPIEVINEWIVRRLTGIDHD